MEWKTIFCECIYLMKALVISRLPVLGQFVLHSRSALKTGLYLQDPTWQLTQAPIGGHQRNGQLTAFNLCPVCQYFWWRDITLQGFLYCWSLKSCILLSVPVYLYVFFMCLLIQHPFCYLIGTGFAKLLFLAVNWFLPLSHLDVK